MKRMYLHNNATNRTQRVNVWLVVSGHSIVVLLRCCYEAKLPTLPVSHNQASVLWTVSMLRRTQLQPHRGTALNYHSPLVVEYLGEKKKHANCNVFQGVRV